MNKYQNKIAITTGDPNGIGAEITIKALNRLSLPDESLVLISNKKVLDCYGKLKGNYEIIEINNKSIENLKNIKFELVQVYFF